MILAIGLALLASVLFAGTAVSVRVASLKSDIIDGVIASTILSVPISLVVAQANGEFSVLVYAPAETYLYFVAVGLIHYYAARYLGYLSISRVGANIGSMLMHSSAFFAPLLAVLVLGESMPLNVVVEVFLITLGIVLTSCAGWSWSPSGILIGLSSGFLMAVSSILVKLAYKEVYTPASGVAIASSVGLVLAVATKKVLLREYIGLRNIPKEYWTVSFTATSGQLARFAAIGLAPVSLIVPLTHLVPVFTAILAFITVRKLEVFNARVLAGVTLAFAGVIAAYIGGVSGSLT